MKILLLTVIIATAASSAPAVKEDVLHEQAADLHRKILVMDTHIDIPLNYAGEKSSDPGQTESGLKASLDSMQLGGYGCAFLITYTPQGKLSDEATAAARREFCEDRLDGIDRMLDNYPLAAVKVLSPDDVLAARQKGLLAVAIGMENGYPLGRDLSSLKYFYDRGVRYITLTHNGDNLIADSANPPNRAYPHAVDPRDKSIRLLRDVYIAEDMAAGPPPGTNGGLSDFGRQVVAEMNRMGIMIDVSHTAPSTVEDVLEVSAAPVIASHSCCRAICDNRRNLTDDQLRAIAAKGGVVQLTAVPTFVYGPAGLLDSYKELMSKIGALDTGFDKLYDLWQNDRATYDQYSQPYLDEVAEIDKNYHAPGLKDFIDHIDHVVQVAGIEHVGIGSDFDGGGGVPGFRNPSDAPGVTEELLRRGYTTGQIELIWGGNLMRVWRDVEAVSKKLSGK